MSSVTITLDKEKGEEQIREGETATKTSKRRFTSCQLVTLRIQDDHPDLSSVSIDPRTARVLICGVVGGDTGENSARSV
jgi:hypothetical protein